MRTSLSIRATAGAAALMLLLAACGGDEGEEPDGAPEPEETVEAAEPDRWPLTGVVSDDPIEPGHPVMVVKYDNTQQSTPQRGLGDADLVVEELVEGGYTRLAAFFHSELPELVGPVRSLRTSDIGIVRPAQAHLVTSGAAPGVINRVRNAGLTFHQEGAPGFRRDSSRRAPYNLMADLSVTAEAAGEPDGLPRGYLPWGDASDLPEGVPATTIAANFGTHVSRWEFRRGKYRNTNTYAAEGDRFVADTVLAIKVSVTDAGYRDPAGNFVPESVFRGRGDAVLFHDGQAIEATWRKRNASSPVRLVTEDGAIVVPPGNTWITLLPADTAGGRIRPGGLEWSE